jgi:hypothetical protein
MPHPPRQRQKEMINSPCDWPRWPLLPLKRVPTTSFADIGYIYGDPPKDGTITIYVGGNIYHPTLNNDQAKTYTDVDALLDDGWLVD